jgi:outer membrane receptor for ferrienterochelin and colicins
VSQDLQITPAGPCSSCVNGIRLAAPLVALLAASPALAAPAPHEQEQELEGLDLGSLLDTPEEVWTATKTEQKSSEAPAIITTVTREQIAVWGYQSMADVLSHLLGFYVVDDHASANLAVRGVSGGLHADSSIVKIMIDGHSVAFHSTGGNWLGPELCPLTAVERIEIVRGPGSALFGADAFLGVINIRTRTGKSLGGSNAWLGMGMAGRKPSADADVSAGFASGPWDVLIAGRYNRQDLSGLALPATSSAPSIPRYNFGATQAQGMSQQATSLLGRVTYRPRTTTELAAFVYLSSFDRGAEFDSLYQLVYHANDQGIQAENRLALGQMRAGLLFDQSLGRQTRLSLRASLFSGRASPNNRLEVGSEFYYVRRELGFRGADLDGQLEWKPVWGPLSGLRLVTGASLFLDDEQLPSRIAIAKQSPAGPTPGEPIEGISVRQGRKNFVNAGAYLQGIWAAVDRYLSLTGGVRYDWHNIYGGQVSERLGIVSNPSSTLHGKLLYGNAFRAPSPTLLYAVPSAIGDVSGNPDLRPQYVSTWEAQIAYEPTELVSLSTDVAYNVLRDHTEFVQQGIHQVARNVARAGTVSWETMLELKYEAYVRGYLSFEVQRTSKQTGAEGYQADVVGSEGGIYPRRMIHAGVVGQPAGWPLRGTVQVSYIGERQPSDTNIVLNGGSYDLPAYLLLESGISTRGFHILGSTQHTVAFSLIGKNLLNQVGPAPGFSGVDYPLAPRSFLLQAQVGL